MYVVIFLPLFNVFINSDFNKKLKIFSINLRSSLGSEQVEYCLEKHTGKYK